MTQLSLLGYRATRPVAALSVTHLLWTAAGRPTNTTDLTGAVDARQIPGAACWWCGHPAPDGWVRPVSCLPDTFPYPLESAIPESRWLCLPCGWTLCDRIALPRAIGEARIRARAVKGGRLIVSVRGAPAERWLVLELADGSVGLWTPATTNAAAEEPWTEAVDELRAEPRDVGPCRFVERVPYEVLAPEATEKWRSFHHVVARGEWWPFTDTDRITLRELLLSPPPPPWAVVIGDGKKHHGIVAQQLDAVTTRPDVHVVYHRGDVVVYEPADLARAIAAVEALVVAGADDPSIETGLYTPPTRPGVSPAAFRLAVAQHDPVVAGIRGGKMLPLVMYLRRSRADLGVARG